MALMLLQPRYAKWLDPKRPSSRHSSQLLVREAPLQREHDTGFIHQVRRPIDELRYCSDRARNHGSKSPLRDKTFGSRLDCRDIFQL